MGCANLMRSSLLITSLLLSGCLEAPDQKQRDIEGLLVRADAYAQQSQYRAAIIEAKNILQKAPGNVDAQLIIARINIELGGINYASDLLEKIDTPRTDVALLLAQTYMLQGKIKSTLKTLEQLDLPSLPPLERAKYLYIKASILAQSQNYTEAKALFTEAKETKGAAKETKNKAHLSLIKLQIMDKDFDGAEKELETLLVDSPKYADALVLKSKIAYKNDDLEHAEDLLSRALISLERTDIITDQRIMVLRNLSHLLAKRGRPAEAMVYNRLIAEARPDESDTRNKIERAVEAYQEGQIDEAETLLSELYSEGETDYVGMLIGAIKLEKGEFDNAYQYFAKHIDPETASPEALKMLTEVQLRQNKPGEVLKSIELNSKKNPDDAQQQAIYGLAALSMGEEKAGIDAINKALKLDPNKTRLRVALAKYFNDRQKPEKALEQLRLATKESPDDNVLQSIYINQLIVTGDKNKALVTAKKLYQKSPSVQNKLLYAGALNTIGNKNKAIKLYESILKTHPGESTAIRQLALIHLANNEIPKAQEMAKRLTESAPNNPYGYQILYSTAGDVEIRNKLTESSLTAMNKDKSLWAPAAFMIVNYAENNNLDAAVQLAHKLTENANANLIPKSAALNVWGLLNRHYKSRNDAEGIRQALLGSLSLRPNNEDLNFELVAHEINQGELLEAEKLIDGLHRSKSFSPHLAAILSGDLRHAEGKKTKAVEIYRTVWANYKSNKLGLRIFNSLNGIEASQTEIDKHINEWLEAIPNSTEALVLLGNKYMAENKNSDAMIVFKRAITANPNNAFALNNLAWLEYQDGKLKQASLRAEKAYRIAPNNAAIADTYGWILFKTGKKEQAVTILELAQKLAPNNKEIAEHLAQAKK